MHISARVRNSGSMHEATVDTSGASKAIAIPSKAAGSGSSVNGGELLMLALATCYGNDLYREAARLGVVVRALEVVAEADFDGVGMAATNIKYRAKVDSPASVQDIQRLLAETDAVAEIQNTVRAGVPIVLRPWGEGAADDRGTSSMRKQYHSRPASRGRFIWDVHHLVELSKDLPRIRVAVNSIRELDEAFWFGGAGDVATCKAVADHARLIQATDLAHPIILSSDGRVMDGMHRVAKAYMLGHTEIEAVRFAIDPEPDYVDVPEDQLPYDD